MQWCFWKQRGAAINTALDFQTLAPKIQALGKRGISKPFIDHSTKLIPKQQVNGYSKLVLIPIFSLPGGFCAKWKSQPSRRFSKISEPHWRNHDICSITDIIHMCLCLVEAGRKVRNEEARIFIANFVTLSMSTLNIYKAQLLKNTYTTL